jgi:hypothetical protein
MSSKGGVAIGVGAVAEGNSVAIGKGAHASDGQVVITGVDISAKHVRIVCPKCSRINCKC